MMAALTDIGLARPEVLWLVLLLPLFWWWRSGSRAVMLLRSISMLLLIFGLAGPERVAETTERAEPEARIFAFDLSRSIQPPARRWMLETAQKIMATPGRDRYFIFADRAREVEDWQTWLQQKVPAEVVQPGKTNLSSLLRTLSRDTATAETLYLFTDGWETEGKVRNDLPLLSRSRTRIVPMAPPGKQDAPNVRVERILAPHRGESREGVRLKVRLLNMNGEPVRGELVWTRDDRPWKTDALVLEPGYQLRSYETVLPEKGLVSFRATFVPENPEEDVFEQDNEAAAWISVEAKDKVLIAST